MNHVINNPRTNNVPIAGLCAANMNMSQFPQIELPEIVGDMIPTLNKHGYMKVLMDEFSKEFVDFAVKASKPVLEIGCAYGYTAMEVLRGTGQIIANDISLEHLLYLVNNIGEQYRKNLFIYQKAFPEDFQVPDESVSGILCSRMMHFLRGNQVEEGLVKISRMLAKNGKFFFVALSPYFGPLSDNNFHKTYKERLAKGDKWPGEIEDHLQMAHIHSKFVGKFLHVFEDIKLRELLPKFGFEIERIKLFEYPGDLESGNMGHVGFVARKVHTL